MSDQEPPRTKTFWVLSVIGLGVIGYGARGLFAHGVETRPAHVFTLIAANAVAHDAIVAPVTLAFGALVLRRVRAPLRAPLTVALLLSGVTAIYAYPFVRGYGRDPGTPSRLPNNYALGLTQVLVAVWAATLLWSIVASVRRLRRT